MKKKLLTWMAAGAVFLSLTGCGKGDDAQTAETDPGISAAEEVSAQDAAALAGAEGDDAAEAVPAETSAETAEAIAAAPESAEAVGFSVGSVTGRVYENDFLGITFTAPDDMRFSSEEELARLSALTAGMMEDLKEIQQALENGGVLITCNASGDASTLPIRSFNLTMQNAETAQTAADAALSEELVLYAARTQLPSVLEQNGFSDVKASLSSMTFLGEEHSCLTLSALLPDGSTLYERQICIIRDGYINSLTASVIGGEDTTQEILAQVKAK